jgi:hypothetical protein
VLWSGRQNRNRLCDTSRQSSRHLTQHVISVLLPLTTPRNTMSILCGYLASLLPASAMKPVRWVRSGREHVHCLQSSRAHRKLRQQMQRSRGEHTQINTCTNQNLCCRGCRRHTLRAQCSKCTTYSSIGAPATMADHSGTQISASPC